MKLRPFLIALFAFTLSLSARADWGSKVTEPFEFEGSFSPDGIVQVENVNGRITIEAWDRDAYAISGEKRAKNDDDLELIKIEQEIDRDRIYFKVKLGKKKGWFNWGNVNGSVNVTLHVPATVTVKEVSTVNGDVRISGLTGRTHASTVNGGLEAYNLAGATHMSTVNGGIRAEFTHVDPDARLEFSTVNGGIRLSLPADAGVHVSASVVNGHVEADLPITMKGRIGKKSINGTIGDGSASLKASTVNGSIRIYGTDT
ncbi:DUF4097 family beta strand repeat-containing protein [Actomonas aquatica]|uniref:DUF4097 family beta strand repeat-containing protein n=1 Tax=Actomonas aquatica TaxID=2866162 RepID=A0ABZ1C9K9_9BACT|nr:DUF4097 family beta strand repeat-containing protein [Opitutus sp. WL0086]WRQ88379.1 DUF4097 family beta strand repeat-containing protein [Opitutus sp. WL0086]